MYNGKKILAVILARGGSKRIPEKNIKLLKNKPLIAYTLEEAEKCTLLDRIVISSDDEKILDICRTYKCTLQTRPKELAEDSTPSIDVLQYVMKETEQQEKYDVIVLLQPTSPLRKSAAIEECIRMLIDHTVDSVQTITKAKEHPSIMFKKESDHFVFNSKEFQDPKGEYYVLNGAVYAVTASVLKSGTLYGARNKSVIMDQSESIDIDTMDDWIIAEQRLEIRNIPLSAPFIEEDDIQAVVNVLRTSTLSLGPKLQEFEEKVAAYIGTKYAVAVNSGTSALHLAAKAIGLKPGDEVITTPFTFVATANAILFEHATPIFADIDEHTYTIDPNEIEKKITPKTKAIIDVDVFGYPSHKTELAAIAKKHNLKIIEDSAEAIGTTYDGKKVGSFFECGIFAFYPNKQLTTGEGGILVTNNEEIAKLAKSYRNQGRGESGPWLQHVRIGYNYRLSDINCALGISQMNKVERILAKREKKAELYTKILSTFPEITIPPQSTEHRKVSWFVYVIQVPKRDEVMKRLKQRGVNCAAYFTPLHLTDFYQKEFSFKKGDFPVCERIAERTLALPFYTAISSEQIEYVCKQLREILDELQ